MKKITLIALASFAFQFTLAQKYESGYYITRSGDTTKADIFIKPKAGKVLIEVKDGKALKPIDVLGAGLAADTYVSKVVEIDKSPKIKGLVTDTVLLEVLVRGKVSLLYFIDEYDKAHFFIEKVDGTVEELGLMHMDLGDNLHFQKLTTYKDVLKKNFSGCTELFPEIDKTPYAKNKIQSIFIKLHTCSYGPLTVRKSKAETTVAFGVFAGAAITKINFTKGAATPVQASLYDFKSSSDPLFGLSLDLKFTRTGKLVVFRNELYYRSFSTSSNTITESTLFQSQSSSNAAFEVSYLKYNFLFRNYFSYEKTRLFFNVGASLAKILANNNNKITRTTSAFGGPPTIETVPLFGDTNGFDFGLLTGLGLAFNNLSFEARGEYSFGFQAKSINTAPTFSGYIIVAYQFNKSKK